MLPLLHIHLFFFIVFKNVKGLLSSQGLQKQAPAWFANPWCMVVVLLDSLLKCLHVWCCVCVITFKILGITKIDFIRRQSSFYNFYYLDFTSDNNPRSEPIGKGDCLDLPPLWLISSPRINGASYNQLPTHMPPPPLLPPTFPPLICFKSFIHPLDQSQRCV